MLGVFVVCVVCVGVCERVCVSGGWREWAFTSPALVSDHIVEELNKQDCVHETEVHCIDNLRGERERERERNK